MISIQHLSATTKCSSITHRMRAFYSARREPKDDIPPKSFSPAFRRVENCSFIRQAIRASCAKKVLKSKGETRKSLVKRFINASRRKGQQYLLKTINPLCSYFLWKCFPSYYLRLRYQLTSNDFSKMTSEELLELLRLSYAKKEVELYKSVANELEQRLRHG